MGIEQMGTGGNGMLKAIPVHLYFGSLGRFRMSRSQGIISPHVHLPPKFSGYPEDQTPNGGYARPQRGVSIIQVQCKRQ